MIYMNKKSHMRIAFSGNRVHMHNAFVKTIEVTFYGVYNWRTDSLCKFYEA